MRKAHFAFAPTYTPLNHGSFGTSSIPVRNAQTAFQTQADERPDPFIVYDTYTYIDQSRAAIAPYLGVTTDEVVFLPNATTGVNVVLRNLKWEEGDVVVCFSTIYDACLKTLASVQEGGGKLEIEMVEMVYPVEDLVIVEKFRNAIEGLKKRGKRARLAMFDTVLTFPGARVPWEELTRVCKETGILSLIDGAHGIGHINLKHVGEVGPDFFVSNCHKWFYNPRGCAVFYVPFRNQHLTRTSLPTSHGYQYPNTPASPSTPSTFVELFKFVATIDYTPYLCIPAAIKFRNEVCGGEEAIRAYCYDLARKGGDRTADILGTSVMTTKGGEMRECYFANIELPITFVEGGGKKEEGHFGVDETFRIGTWLQRTAVKECDTYLQIAFHAGKMWVRLSAQIYLEMSDFEWVGERLKELCERVRKGEAE